MREKTFGITYNNSDGKGIYPDGVPRFNYIFSWDDGEIQTFIVVPLHGAMALGKHFDSLGYQDMVHIAPTHHGYIELDYRRDHAKRLQALAKATEGLPFSD